MARKTYFMPSDREVRAQIWHSEGHGAHYRPMTRFDGFVSARLMRVAVMQKLGEKAEAARLRADLADVFFARSEAAK